MKLTHIIRRCHRSKAVVGSHVAIASLLGSILAFGCGEPTITKTSNNQAQPADAGVDVPSDLPGPDEDLQSFAFSTSESLCEKIFECCSDSERSENLGMQADSVAQCTDQSSFFGFTFGYGQLDSSIKAGRIVVDQGMAELCIQSLQETSCADFSDSASIDTSIPGCGDVFEPQVEDGDECEVDQDCKSDFCNQEEGASASTCAPLPRDGQDCPLMRCADGLFCDTLDFVCAPLRENGQGCQNDTECQSSHCATNNDGELVCQDRAPLCSGG